MEYDVENGAFSLGSKYFSFFQFLFFKNDVDYRVLRSHGSGYLFLNHTRHPTLSRLSKPHWLLVTDCHVFIENWTIAINLWSLQLDRSVFGKFHYLSYFSVFGRNVECRIRCLVSVINLEQLVCILRLLNVFISILLKNPFPRDYFQSY